MKALYILWPNYEFIDKAVDSGIDTLLVTCHDLPFDVPSRYYDSRESVYETLNRYKGKVDLILVPLWSRPWYNIPDMQRWMLESGKYLTHTPCPTSRSYMRSRIVPAVNLAEEYGCKGIIWDLEHLEKNKNDAIPFYETLSKPEHRCYCPTCRQYNMEDLWKVHADAIKKLLEPSGLQIHGQMPYSGGWTMRQFPEKLYHFSEETYQHDVGYIDHFKWKYTWSKAHVSPKFIPGIWCEWQECEQALIDYIKRIYDKYDNFWLYSHEFFGNKIPNPHVNYPMKGPASDWFFQELRKI